MTAPVLWVLCHLRPLPSPQLLWGVVGMIQGQAGAGPQVLASVPTSCTGSMYPKTAQTESSLEGARHQIQTPIRNRQEGEIMGNWMPQEKVTLIHCPEKPWEASGHDCSL